VAWLRSARPDEDLRPLVEPASGADDDPRDHPDRLDGSRRRLPHSPPDPASRPGRAEQRMLERPRTRPALRARPTRLDCLVRLVDRRPTPAASHTRSVTLAAAGLRRLVLEIADRLRGEGL
jgi:hypothetical protein